MFNIDKAVNYNKSQMKNGNLLPVPKKFRTFEFDSEEFATTIIAFQAFYGDLKDDGMCGPNTIKKMKEIYPNDQTNQITGKGFFLWKYYHAIGKPKGKKDTRQKIEQWCSDYLVPGKIDHILVKTADGRSRHNSNIAEPIAKILPKNGIKTFPWVYCWNYKNKKKLEQEIDVHARTYEIMNSPGIIVLNAEKGMKKKRNNEIIYDYSEQAIEYMRKLKEKTGAILYLSSYGFTKWHRKTFPFQEMINLSDLVSPQCYCSVRGCHNDPERCLVKSISDWSEFSKGKKKIIPALGCWQKKENNSWLDYWHNSLQIKNAMSWMKRKGAKGITFWLWLEPGKNFGKARMTKEQWNTIKEFNL